jgi:putative membrane protein
MSIVRHALIASIAGSLCWSFGCEEDQRNDSGTLPGPSSSSDRRGSSVTAAGTSGSARSGASGGAAAATTMGRAGAPNTSGSGAAGAMESLNDAQIAQLMMTVNSGEIMQGELATTRAADERVRLYAGRMVTEHTAANTALMALTSTLSLTPRESMTSAQLRTEAAAALESLEGASDLEFDEAYMMAQVMQHQRVLGLLTMLAPTAREDELSDATSTMRAAVEEHLEEGQELLNELTEANR